MQTLTLRCTLKPATEQVAALEATVRLFAEGCNHALRVAREKGEFRRFKLHRLVYNDLRSMGLSANLAVQAIARVGRKKGSRAKFYQPTSATFDVRTLSLRDESVFLTTTAGRLVIPMKLGNYQRGMLKRAKSVQGGVLTKGPKGKWYINLILRLEVPTPPTGGGKVVGLDMGQRYMATLSSGVQFSGGSIKGKRLHYQSDLLKLWASAENAVVGKSFQMPVLRSGVRPRPQCCGKHFGIGAAIPGYQSLEAHDFSRGSSHRKYL